jgi:PelA/Pel-15E family pectate lyase
MKTYLTPRFLLCVALTLTTAPLLSARIIGTNPPAQPLTIERVGYLPEALQPAWRKYLENSLRQSKADRDFFLNEAKQASPRHRPPPPPGKQRSRLPLNEATSWYAGPEGQRIADIVISFQTPAGGWSKNLDLTTRQRAPGELFNGDTPARHAGSSDFDPLQKLSWSYVGTFDNDATITELRFLAKVINAIGSELDSPHRRAFLHGIDYVLAAQFPNGGWPQVWPLAGGYHDAITYNDDAMINVLQLLNDMADGAKDFSFVPAATRTLAAAAVQRGIECILDTQVNAHGTRTVWCQQHDLLTLQPTSARNYEMPAQVGGESAGIMIFLMRLPHPDLKLVAAVHDAAAWFERTQLRDVAFKAVGDEGRQLVASLGAGPLWARYYQIGSDRPVFGDRDKSIHDNVSELSQERRNGYSWFGDGPKRALEQYRQWRQWHPRLLGKR